MAKRPELAELVSLATRGSRTQFWLDQIAERRRQRREQVSHPWANATGTSLTGIYDVYRTLQQNQMRFTMTTHT